MLRISLAFVVLAAVCGCGDPEKIQLAPKPVLSTPNPAKAPDFNESPVLKLVHDEAELHVGDDAQSAIRFVPRPKRAYEVRDLPPGFGPGFLAQGWENEAEGFGSILYDGRVVVAMRSLRKVDQARVATEIETLRARLGNESHSVAGAAARYWIWEGERERLVACAVKDGTNGFILTMALGETNAMNALRLNQVAAESDAKRADRAPKPPTNE